MANRKAVGIPSLESTLLLLSKEPKMEEYEIQAIAYSLNGEIEVEGQRLFCDADFTQKYGGIHSWQIKKSLFWLRYNGWVRYSEQSNGEPTLLYEITEEGRKAVQTITKEQSSKGKLTTQLIKGLELHLKDRKEHQTLDINKRFLQMQEAIPL